jgi:hypothetical protein
MREMLTTVVDFCSTNMDMFFELGVNSLSRVNEALLEAGRRLGMDKAEIGPWETIHFWLV